MDPWLASESSIRELWNPLLPSADPATAGHRRTGTIWFYVVNRLPVHIHHHLYWIVPLLILGMALLVYWALTSTDNQGPQL